MAIHSLTSRPQLSVADSGLLCVQGAGWMQQLAVPSARDARALRITLAGANGVLGTAEHQLQQVCRYCDLVRSV